MAGLLERIAAERRRSSGGEQRYSADTWLQDFLLPSLSNFGYGGNQYPIGLNASYAPTKAVEITATLPSYTGAVKQTPPAFGAEMIRALVLSQARFVFRNRMGSRTPRRIFGTSALGLLEKPWPNATTGELIARMEWHAGLAGNSFVARRPSRLRILRPDWTAIIYGSELEPEDPSHAIDGEILGYVYCNGGFNSENRATMTTLLPNEVAHWSPLPDPLNAGLGMSWLTPAIRDMQGDQLASQHKIRYFENGAPQPLDAKVLTPAGWSTMGEMFAGGEVIGSDGKAHSVLAIYPQGERDIYRVTFADGSSAECTLDHLWTVSNNLDRKSGRTRTMKLGEIVAGGFHYPSGPAKWAVPMADPVEFAQADELPIDPYLMGLLLGDGSFRSNGRGSGGVTLTASAPDADETQQIITSMLPTGVGLSRRDRGGWAEFYFRGPRAVTRGERGRIATHTPNPMTAAIKHLGLFDVIGREKFIPAAYLTAGIKERVGLLQGLIDSDGHVSDTALRLTTTSRRLAEDVVELVGSLGGAATIKATKSRSTMTVNVRQLPDWIVPARLLRKANRYAPSSALRVRTMVSAELVRRSEAQCIAVDSSDHLYVTDGYVLTHNTPNLVVKGLSAATKAQFDELVDAMEDRHAGMRNAYRTLYLTAGADATVIGSNLKDIDLKSTQGSGETRISMLSRVPAPILGIAEGLAGSSLNAGNFGMARRNFADTWVYPTLTDLCAALSSLITVPGDAELWFDTSDIPLLREDGKDAAEIMNRRMLTVESGVRAGFKPESVVDAIQSGDLSKMQHTGLYSVQLQPPGTVLKGAPAPTGEPAADDPAAD